MITKPAIVPLLGTVKHLRTKPTANAIRFGTLYNFRFDARSAATSCQCQCRVLQNGFANDSRSPSTRRWHANAYTYGDGNRNADSDCHSHTNSDCYVNSYAKPTSTPRPSPTVRPRPTPAARP